MVGWKPYIPPPFETASTIHSNSVADTLISDTGRECMMMM
jgi:hypothetical protein